MLKQESVQGNETHKITSDLEIKTDHPISTRRPDLDVILFDFAVPVDSKVKMKEIEKCTNTRTLPES